MRIETTRTGRDPVGVDLPDLGRSRGSSPGCRSRTRVGDAGTATSDGRPRRAGTYVAVAAVARPGRQPRHARSRSTRRACPRCATAAPLAGPRRHHRPLPRASSRRPCRSAAGATMVIGVDARGAPLRLDAAPARRAEPVRSGATTRTRRSRVTAPPATSPASTSSRLAAGLHARRRRRRPSCDRAAARSWSCCPFMTWQGRNAVDDDGDGAPNILDRGVAGARRRGSSQAAALPAGFREAEAPLLSYLDRNERLLRRHHRRRPGRRPRAEARRAPRRAAARRRALAAARPRSSAAPLRRAGRDARAHRTGLAAPRRVADRPTAAWFARPRPRRPTSSARG